MNFFKKAKDFLFPGQNLLEEIEKTGHATSKYITQMHEICETNSTSIASLVESMTHLLQALYDLEKRVYDLEKQLVTPSVKFDKN